MQTCRQADRQTVVDSLDGPLFDKLIEKHVDSLTGCSADRVEG